MAYGRESLPQKIFTRIIYCLGVLTLFVILAALVDGVYALYLVRLSERPAAVYANDSIRAIVPTWSEDEIIKRSSAWFRAQATQGQLDQMFDTLRKLGNFQSYSGIRERPHMTYLYNKFSVRATFHAKASYVKGWVEITITISGGGSNWQIDGFHVDAHGFPK
jgi:hypothetical protein